MEDRDYLSNQRMTRLENSLLFIPKATDEQVETYKEIRQEAVNFAFFLARRCPESREFSIAMTNFEDAIMWAINSIARNE